MYTWESFLAKHQVSYFEDYFQLMKKVLYIGLCYNNYLFQVTSDIGVCRQNVGNDEAPMLPSSHILWAWRNLEI